MDMDTVAVAAAALVVGGVVGMVPVVVRSARCRGTWTP